VAGLKNHHHCSTMLKITFKLTGDELTGIAALIEGYLQCMGFAHTQGKWLKVTLYRLVTKLRAAETKRMLHGKAAQKVSFDVNEALAFELLLSRHAFDCTNYIDNSCMQLLNAIRQFYV
jgi:hypothetical protein